MREMHPDHTELDSIEPSDAQELYLKYKATEVTENTLDAHKYQTNHFIRWCDEEGIDDMNNFSARPIQEYRLWRQDYGDLRKITRNQRMSTTAYS